MSDFDSFHYSYGKSIFLAGTLANLTETGSDGKRGFFDF